MFKDPNAQWQILVDILRTNHPALQHHNWNEQRPQPHGYENLNLRKFYVTSGYKNLHFVIYNKIYRTSQTNSLY